MTDFPLEERVLPRVLRSAAEAQPEWPFLLHADQVFTYADTERLSTQLAHGLRRWGVSRGARVGLILDNDPRYVLTLFAVAKLGALNVPINTAARGDLPRHGARAHQVAQTDPRPALRPQEDARCAQAASPRFSLGSRRSARFASLSTTSLFSAKSEPPG